jgi:hypothetical protein
VVPRPGHSRLRQSYTDSGTEGALANPDKARPQDQPSPVVEAWGRVVSNRRAARPRPRFPSTLNSPPRVVNGNHGQLAE